MRLRFIHKILELIFPPRCFGCRRVGFYVCSACLEKINPVDNTDLSDSYALFSYTHPVAKKLVWKLKYHGLTATTELLASLLYELILPEIADFALFGKGKVLVIPVPLSSKRLKWRGFNQAAVLAKNLSLKNQEILSYQPDLLKKIKDTPTQVSIRNRTERLKNLRGSFVVTEPERIKGKIIITVDDVITTGATMTEARRVLLAAGASRILALAVAHG